jgi:deazaflavin-dependent oxidoreductase (nitroreductase family)
VTLPRWVLGIGWAVHKGLMRVSGGRIGTERARSNQPGTLFLRTTGRTTGKVRRNGLFYLDVDGGFVVVASNAGLDTDPSWWRNLEAAPDAIVELAGREYPVRAREAHGAERDRLYARFEAAAGQYRAYRERTTRTIPVIVLESRNDGSEGTS